MTKTQAAPRRLRSGHVPRDARRRDGAGRTTEAPGHRHEHERGDDEAAGSGYAQELADETGKFGMHGATPVIGGWRQRARADLSASYAKAIRDPGRPRWEGEEAAGRPGCERGQAFVTPASSGRTRNQAAYSAGRNSSVSAVATIRPPMIATAIGP